MSKICPTCGANWDDGHGFNLPEEARYKPVPHACAVCMGTGLVPAGFYSRTSTTWSGSATAPAERCRACGGTGVLWG